MPGAIAKPSKGKKGPDPSEDAFLRFLNRAVDWTRDNLAVVVGGTAVVLVLVLGGLWYVSYTRDLEERAASRLQSLRAALAMGTDTLGVPQLEEFLDRFEGTEAALHGGVMLARQQLEAGEAGASVETLRPVVEGKPVDTPLGYAARKLLGQAQAAAGRREEALETFGRLARDARFGFQRRQAAAERAELLVEAGRLAEAETVYERLVEETPPSEPQSVYALRLGEIRARLSGSAAGAEDSSPPPDPSGQEDPTG